MEAKSRREALLLEAEKRGLLPPETQAQLVEARRRGLVGGPLPVDPPAKPLYDLGVPESLEGGVVHGMVRGVNDLLDSSAQLTAHGLEALAPSGSGFERWAQGNREATERGVKAGLEHYRRAREKAGRGDRFDWGRYVFNPLNFIGGVGLASKVPQTFRFGERVGAGLLGGAAFNTATTPVEEPASGFWDEKRHQATVGGLLGGVVPAVAHPLSRLLQPGRVVSADAKALVDEGVHIPVGGLLGDSTKVVEDSMRSLPITGERINRAYRGATEEFNTAAVNRVMKQVGPPLGGHVPPGHAQIGALHGRLSELYQDVLPQLHGRRDGLFEQALAGIQKRAEAVLPPNELKQYNAFIENQVTRRFDERGFIGGEALKDVETALGNESVKNTRAANQLDKNNKGYLLLEVQDAFHGMLARYNPELASELKRLNEAWGHYKILEDAASGLGAKEGVFSPSLLKHASRRHDATQGKRASAQGQARFQDFAQAGERYLGNTVADSGTTGRALTNATLTGISPIGAKVMAMSLPYWPGVREVMAKMLAKERSPNIEAMGRLLERLGIGLVPTAASGVPGLWGE
ncbi:MAG: hypothetical protein ABW150_18750 [Candidatus Thiodiazotropha sp.]